MGWLSDSFDKWVGTATLGAVGGDSGGGPGGPYEFQDHIRKSPGDVWLWNKDNWVWNMDSIQSVVKGNQLFESAARPIDAAWRTARVETAQALARSGLEDSGAGAMMNRELTTSRGEQLSGARAQADLAKAQFTSGFWSDALNRQLQAKGMRYGWLSNQTRTEAQEDASEREFWGNLAGAAGSALGGL